MQRYLSRDTLAELVSLLECETDIAAHHRRAAHLEVIKSGWAAKHNLEDLLYETSRSAELFVRDSQRLSEFLGAYKISYESRFERPKHRQKEVTGFRHVRAADAAAFMIELERLGFGVDPLPLVEGLRGNILKKTHITSSELSVFWFKDQRHRSVAIDLLVKDCQATTYRQFETATGYKACLLADADGPVGFRVDAPRQKGGLNPVLWAKLHVSGRMKERVRGTPLITEAW